MTRAEAKALLKFERQARKRLSYTTIAAMEYVLYGVTFEHIDARATRVYGAGSARRWLSSCDPGGVKLIGADSDDELWWRAFKLPKVEE